MATVFGAVDFLDTFAHYPITQITGYGKWSSQLSSGGSAVTVSEDGLQGLSGGFLNKLLPTGSVGRIAGTRGFGESGSSRRVLFRIAKADDTSIAILEYEGLIAQLKLSIVNVTGAPAAITTTLLNIPNGSRFNIDFAILFNGGVCNYRTRLNSNTVVTELTGSFATADVPSMQILSTYSGASNQGIPERSWIYTKPWSSGAWVDADIDAAFLGNVSRGLQYPNAEGVDTIANNWDASGGVTSPNVYTLVNETLADPANYVSTTVDPGGSPTAAHKIAFRLTDTPATLTAVKAVQRNDLIWMQTGVGVVRLGNRVDGTGAGTFDSTFNVPSTPTFKITPYGVDPRDSGAWDKTKLDNLEVITQTWDLT